MYEIEYFDRKGRRITSEELQRLLFQNDYKRVAEDAVEDTLWVSTVWLGLNHAWWPGGVEIFETMVFGAGSYHGVPDFGQRRYATEEEALAGHKEVVLEAKEWMAKNSVSEELLTKLLETPPQP